LAPATMANAAMSETGKRKALSSRLYAPLD
jgi:hypothetical protein